MFLRRLSLALLAAALITTVLHGATETAAVVTVSAASFEATSVAPDAIAATFGAALAPSIESADDSDPLTPGVQLPTQLLGTTVEINGVAAQLLFVSPGQINFVVPSETEPGDAEVIVYNGTSVVAHGTVTATPVSSGVFTANSDGKGVAAALAFRLRPDGSSQYEPVATYDANSQRFFAAPINLNVEDDKVYLVVFATGIRHATDTNGDGNLNESVRILLGGEELTPVFAGQQGGFVGLDQVNVEIPRSLIGSGEVTFAIAIDGAVASNQAQISIANAETAEGPLVSGFNVSTALAGQAVGINGTGFSNNPDNNQVRINGIEATVTSASPTELFIIVPFGVETGNVSVRTPVGQGSSDGPLLVRTSISGFIEDTARQPLSGVRVKLVGSDISAATTSEGSFVLPDVPIGTQYVEVDGESIPTNPPYPKITLKTIAFANRDNQFARPLSLQQANGASGSIGGDDDGVTGLKVATNAPNQELTAPPFSIEASGYSLLIPGNVSAAFPNGAKTGKLFLTPLAEGRAPVDLPVGVFSSSIVQITPFDVALNPGAKLVFPNTDGLPPDSKASLYRYDSEQGRFVEEAGAATVSSDGLTVSTANNAITRTSYFFVAVSGLTSTVTGRVLEADGVTPVRRALVSLRGQESLTDGNGGYLLRFVPVKRSETIVIEVSCQRPNGRRDRARSVPITALANGTTKAPDIRMPWRLERHAMTIESDKTSDKTSDK